LVERKTFDRVQVLLGNKTYKANELLYGGELITCGHCGRVITGEVIRKSNGREYVYYRCTKYTEMGHPRIRLPESDIDAQVQHLFAKLQQPKPVREWFRAALMASSTSHQEQARARCVDLQRQLDEIRRQQERLLNLHLSGGIDEGAFATKDTELRDRLAILTLE
jgi:hypothetical protein